MITISYFTFELHHLNLYYGHNCHLFPLRQSLFTQKIRRDIIFFNCHIFGKAYVNLRHSSIRFLKKNTNADYLDKSISNITRSSDKPIIGSIVKIIIVVSTSCNNCGIYVGYKHYICEVEVEVDNADEFDDGNRIKFNHYNDNSLISLDVN